MINNESNLKDSNLKSLTYFEDAEREPLPEMIKKINWRRVKEDIRKYVKKSGYI